MIRASNQNKPAYEVSRSSLKPRNGSARITWRFLKIGGDPAAIVRFWRLVPPAGRSAHHQVVPARTFKSAFAVTAMKYSIGLIRSAPTKPPIFLRFRSSEVLIISTVALAIFTDIFLYGVETPKDVVIDS